ncbi:MAG: ribosome-binding factor A, partial [Candidatus Adiutrix sp.]
VKASGFIRGEVADHLHLKYIPEIKFEFDRNLEYAQHMSEILNSLPPSDEATSPFLNEDEDEGEI